jgi:hypothetical protein
VGFRLWWTTETGGDVAEAARVASVGRLSSLEVGEHEDVEQLGAGSRTEGVEAITESALEFIGSHGGRLR